MSAKAMLTPFFFNETNATLYLYLLNEYSIPVIKIKFVFVFVFFAGIVFELLVCRVAVLVRPTHALNHLVCSS